MYILPPGKIKELREKYQNHPDVDEWIIKHFTVGNPINLEKAIERKIIKRNNF